MNYIFYVIVGFVFGRIAQAKLNEIKTKKEEGQFAEWVISEGYIFYNNYWHKKHVHDEIVKCSTKQLYNIWKQQK